MVHFMFITLVSSNVALLYSYVTNVFVYNPHITVCVCKYSDVTRLFSYALVCYSYVLVWYSYVLVCYSYVLVWCFSHDSPVARVLRYFRAAQQILEPEDNDAASDPDDSGDDSQSDSSEMGQFIEHSYVVLVVPDTDVECVSVRSKYRIQVYLQYL